MNAELRTLIQKFMLNFHQIGFKGSHIHIYIGFFIIVEFLRSHMAEFDTYVSKLFQAEEIHS